MAALFYTNHRMKDVTNFFTVWKQLTAKRQNWNMELPDEEAQLIESNNKHGAGR